MNVHVRTPYSLTKNIGQQYNAEMKTIPDGDAACFLDGDMMFLTPNFGHILHEYTNLYPNSVLTSYTNRTHEMSIGQQHPFCKTADVAVCIKQAMSQRHDRSVTPITGVVSMLLQVIPKSVWAQFPFIERNKYRPDEPNILGCDSEWSNRVRAGGVQILRMNGLLMYHQYRLLSNGLDKTHLK